MKMSTLYPVEPAGISDHDKDLASEAADYQAMGRKIEVDAAGDVWLGASLRFRVGVEHLGCADNVDHFRARLERVEYFGS
jgi:hypothetical protein